MYDCTLCGKYGTVKLINRHDHARLIAALSLRIMRSLIVAVLMVYDSNELL